MKDHHIPELPDGWASSASAKSQSLGERLDQRETERHTLEGRFQELSARESQEELRASDKVVGKILEDLERGIQDGDTRALRVLLHSFVKRIEIDKEGGKVLYTFPLASVVLYMSTPGAVRTTGPHGTLPFLP